MLSFSRHDECGETDPTVDDWCVRKSDQTGRCLWDKQQHRQPHNLLFFNSAFDVSEKVQLILTETNPPPVPFNKPHRLCF